MLNKKASLDTIIGEDANFDLIIKVNENKNENEYIDEIKTSNDFFHLESLYQFHKRYVQELLMKKHQCH